MTAADEVVKGLTPALGAKVKAFYLAIGNSIVCAAFLIAAAIVYWGTAQETIAYMINRGPANELTKLRAAQARAQELKNSELERTITLAPLPTWTLASFLVDPTGVQIGFPAFSSAGVLFVQYIAADNSSSGVFEVAMVEGESATMITAADFGASWSAGQTLILNLEQRLADGRAVRYVGDGNVIQVP